MTRIKYILLSIILLTTYGGSYSTYTYIPKKAPALLPILYQEVDNTFDDFQLYSYFAALVEQESCISLKHSRCFDAKSRLYAKRKTGSREEGAGAFQLTRVWRPNGKIRFDSLTALTRKYPKELAGLSWKTVYQRLDLQTKAALLLWRDNYVRIKRNYGDGMKELDLIAFTDAAYNGGYGGVRRDIRKCRSTRGCNPKVWFNNVEKTCTKSKRHLYGRRSACDINREHVRTIFYKRMLKYHRLGFDF